MHAIKLTITIVSTMLFGLILGGAANADSMTPPKNAQIDFYFYRTKVPIKTTIGLTDPQSNRYVSKAITIPKNTVVAGHPTFVKDHRIKTIAIDATALSYHIKKTADRSGYFFEQLQDFTGDIPYSKAKFITAKRPGYMPQASNGNLFAGTVPKSFPNAFQSNKLAVTTDGYVETYPYSSTRLPEGFLNRPAGVAKITKYQRRGQKTFLYYRAHLKGVHDVRVEKTGKARYRLTISGPNRMQTQTVWDGGKQAFVANVYYHDYIVGNQKFYTEIGEKGIDS